MKKRAHNSNGFVSPETRTPTSLGKSNRDPRHRGPRRIWTEEELNSVVGDYLVGDSKYKLSKKYSTSYHQIDCILAERL